MCTSPKPAVADEDEEDEDEEDEDEETAEAKKLSLLCRAGEAQGQQFDQGQTEVEQWACVRYTYANVSDDSPCGMCASPKPAVASVMRAEILTRQAAAAAATSPTRPAPHEAKDASSSIPRRGVSVSLLRHDVVRELVKPATANQKCSYVELLARSQDPQERASVATATVFLSHAWKYSFKNVVEAITAHWPDKGDLRSRTFLWFDIFTVNQHETAKVDQNFWFNAFRENVKDIGHTVLILSPWRNPLPLTRSWCLWEIFCTQDTGARFEICLSQAEAKDFENALLEDFDSIVASLCQIDVNKTQAFKKEDQAKILALVEGEGGGAHETNKAVLAQMRAWLAQAARDALKAREGKTDPRTLALMNQVGRLLYDHGDIMGAEEIFRSCLDASEKTLGLGAEHLNMLPFASNLAASLKRQGKLAEAEPLYRRDLQAHEKTLGAEHPDTLASVNNLALLNAQGKLAEAEPLYSRALQAREKTLGAEHPGTLASVNNLASLLHAQGKLAEAELLNRRALEGMDKTHGPQHPRTLTSAMNLGLFLYEQGRLAEALPLVQQAVSGFETVLGADHPDTQKTKKSLAAASINLGMFLYEQGRLAEARHLAQQAVSGFETILGAEHPDTQKENNFWPLPP
eukprot:g50210.t1